MGALVVAKSKCFGYVGLPILLGDVVKRPVGALLQEASEGWPVQVEVKDWFELGGGSKFRSVGERGVFV